METATQNVPEVRAQLGIATITDDDLAKRLDEINRRQRRRRTPEDQEREELKAKFGE